jgi:hypothetical protein
MDLKSSIQATTLVIAQLLLSCETGFKKIYTRHKLFNIYTIKEV